MMLETTPTSASPQKISVSFVVPIFVFSVVKSFFAVVGDNSNIGFEIINVIPNLFRHPTRKVLNCLSTLHVGCRKQVQHDVYF